MGAPPRIALNLYVVSTYIFFLIIHVKVLTVPICTVYFMKYSTTLQHKRDTHAPLQLRLPRQG